jgi:hypothetical protein
MKTQLSKPARHNARYAQEYEQEALPDLSPGVCVTRIRSVGRGSGSSRAPKLQSVTRRGVRDAALV